MGNIKEYRSRLLLSMYGFLIGKTTGDLETSFWLLFVRKDERNVITQRYVMMFNKMFCYCKFAIAAHDKMIKAKQVFPLSSVCTCFFHFQKPVTSVVFVQNHHFHYT